MSEIPANVVAARQRAITTDYYALGYLALCMVSYSDEAASPDKLEAAVKVNLGMLEQIGDMPGTWTLDWGPAITTRLLSWKANLLFAASYRDPVSQLPIFSAVVLRGTDTSAGFFGLLTQIKEDLEPGCQVPWPQGSGPCATATQSASDVPYIARGTFNGFQDLIGLEGMNQSTRQLQTIDQFLAGFLPTYANGAAPLPLIVTGHSLGGCQTSPMALHLRAQPSAQSGVTVVPNSFAAPTAGNQAFANGYLNTLPSARRWFNTFDLVPMAFDSLATMIELWNAAPYACGCQIPWWGVALLEHFEKDVTGLQYAHEGGGANRQLNGTCLPTGSSKFPWGTELENQHLPPDGYWKLMTEQYSKVLGALQFPAWAGPAPS